MVFYSQIYILETIANLPIAHIDYLNNKFYLRIMKDLLESVKIEMFRRKYSNKTIKQ
jgi:hypothetical protein